MFNNDITYHKKWDTSENIKAHKELQNKYFAKSECYPDCPIAWAPEVLDLLNLLNEELGIKYNETTISGMFSRKSILNYVLIQPFLCSFQTAKFEFFSKKLSKKDKSLCKKLINVFIAGITPIEWGYKLLLTTYINPILNRVCKPKLTLMQIKEKYGELRVYFTCSDCYREWVEKQIRLTELKLAIKGAYYPIETLWNSTTIEYVGNDYNPDTISTSIENDEIRVSKTLYRNLMLQLGLNIEEISQKATLLKKDSNEQDV